MGLFVGIVVSVLILVMWAAFETVVPWIGHALVKTLTFGKIDLGWRSSDAESVVSQWIGFFFLLAIAGLLAAFLQK